MSWFYASVFARDAVANREPGSRYRIAAAARIEYLNACGPASMEPHVSVANLIVEAHRS